jgi:hypothetical protein
MVHEGQPTAEVLLLAMIIAGVVPSPCPTEDVVPVPVYETILNPAVGFALTVEVIVPSVLVALDPPAFQFHAT